MRAIDNPGFHPLGGEKGKFRQVSIEWTAEPICLNAWLDLGVLQVNSVSYTVCDLLKLIANAEGAHYTDVLPALIGRGVNPEDIGTGGEMKYSLANAVRFGFFAYPQIIVFFTGLYLIRRVQELVQSLQADRGVKTSRALDALQLHMAELNTNFFARLPLTRNAHELLLYGKPDGSGNRRTRQVAYRVWSGSNHWDAVKSLASRQLKLHYGIYRSLERILEEAHTNGERFDVFSIQGRVDVFVSGRQPDKTNLDLQVLMRNGLISEFATDSRKIPRDGRKSVLKSRLGPEPAGPWMVHTKRSCQLISSTLSLFQKLLNIRRSVSLQRRVCYLGQCSQVALQDILFHLQQVCGVYAELTQAQAQQ